MLLFEDRRPRRHGLHQSRVLDRPTRPVRPARPRRSLDPLSAWFGSPGRKRLFSIATDHSDMLWSFFPVLLGPIPASREYGREFGCPRASSLSSPEPTQEGGARCAATQAVARRRSPGGGCTPGIRCTHWPSGRPPGAGGLPVCNIVRRASSIASKAATCRVGSSRASSMRRSARWASSYTWSKGLSSCRVLAMIRSVTSAAFSGSRSPTKSLAERRQASEAVASPASSAVRASDWRTSVTRESRSRSGPVAQPFSGSAGS